MENKLKEASFHFITFLPEEKVCVKLLMDNHAWNLLKISLSLGKVIENEIELIKLTNEYHKRIYASFKVMNEIADKNKNEITAFQYDSATMTELNKAVSNFKPEEFGQDQANLKILTDSMEELKKAVEEASKYKFTTSDIKMALKKDD